MSVFGLKHNNFSNVQWCWMKFSTIHCLDKQKAWYLKCFHNTRGDYPQNSLSSCQFLQSSSFLHHPSTTPGHLLVFEKKNAWGPFKFQSQYQYEYGAERVCCYFMQIKGVPFISYLLNVCFFHIFHLFFFLTSLTTPFEIAQGKQTKTFWTSRRKKLDRGLCACLVLNPPWTRQSIQTWFLLWHVTT